MEKPESAGVVYTLSKNFRIKTCTVLHEDTVLKVGRCGGSLEAHQTSGAEVSGAIPASTTMILMRCRISVKQCSKKILR